MITTIVGEGDGQQTFKLQETLLRRLSPVLRANLEHEHLGEGEKGTLRLAEDDAAAWSVLVFWFIERSLPEEDIEKALEDNNGEEPQIVLVNCWTTGDKYGITEFQDLVMLELLQVFGTKWLSPGAAYQAALRSASGSELRALMAREIVSGDKKWEDFNLALSLVGFAAEVLEEVQARQRDPSRRFTMMGNKDGAGRTDAWRRFMLLGPPKHWVYNCYNAPGSPRQREYADD